MRAFVRSGTATGTIISHRVVCFLEGIAHYYPVVRFTTAEGQTVDFRYDRSYPPGSNRYPVGEDVIVRYDPNDPESATIVGQADFMKSALYGLAALAVLLIAYLCLHR